MSQSHLENLENPVFYVTRDIERALGMDLHSKSFFIISNYSDFAKSLANEHKNIFLVKETEKLDTWQLLEKKDVIDFVNNIKKNNASILVFKTTKQIERVCQKNRWKLLNTNANLSNIIERKISQIQWAKENSIDHLFPEYELTTCKDIKWENEKKILQFNHSHTGSGTILIETEKQIREIKKKFPLRPCRIAQYIVGPLFTNNIVIWDSEILLGNISYQITGLKPFTSNPFATIGNDWALPHKILNKDQQTQFIDIALTVGEKMKKSNWIGIFGIDVVWDKKQNKMYLLEINARQPASTSFESILQQPKQDKENVTTFSAYLASLLKIPYNNEKLIKITDGAQIIQRNIKTTINENKIQIIQDNLKLNAMSSIKYENTTFNSDLLRIQSKSGIMKSHNKFSENGKIILEILK